MSKFLSMVCSAAVMFAATSAFSQESKTTSVSVTTSGDRSASNCDKGCPKPKCATPAKKVCCPDVFSNQGMPIEPGFIDPNSIKDCNVPIIDIPKDVCCPCVPRLRYPAAYNAPAGIRVECGLDLNLDIAFTYNRASQDNMDVAFVPPTLAAPVTPDEDSLSDDDSTSTSSAIVSQDFGYEPGFKINIGVDTRYDDWAVNAEYNWFRSANSSITTRDGLKANDWFPGQNTADTTYDTVKAKWTVNTDTLDLLASRPYYEGTKLIVVPTGGLRALWIRQYETITLSTASDSTEDVNGLKSVNSSHSWAIGPKAGVNTQWAIWRGLRAESMVGASLLYTKYTSINNSVENTTDGATEVAKSQAGSLGVVRPAFDMGLGLGYGSYVWRNRLFFDLSARYDFSQFWSQNVMRSFASALNGTNGSVGDLQIQGLTLTLRCDF